MKRKKKKLQQLKGELVASGFQVGAMVADVDSVDDAKLQEKELALLRHCYREPAAKKEEAVTLDLSDIQHFFEERATQKQRCG